MAVVPIELPEEALSALQLSPEEAAVELRFAAAVKLYELERVSSSVAASIAGVARVVFLERLADFGVPTFRLTRNELLEEASGA
ncbi:UPF0175 family protein [Planctomycetota bacterium]